MQIDQTMSETNELVDLLFRFIETNCSNLRNTLRERITLLNGKSEGELSTAVENIESELQLVQKRAVK